MEYLRADAARLLQHVRTVGVKRYLLATNWAPIIEEARAVYYDKSTRDAKTPAEFDALTPERQASYVKRELGEKFYYHTRYGSPHAYARALDLACASLAPEGEGECFRQGMKILDFGCGGIVHLRLLASLGMHVTGVDVDPMLKAFYREPTDQGEIPGVYLPGGERGPSGLLQLVWGRWPADEGVRTSVGDHYDLVISKNTLKNGYINPEREIPESQRITLGVENEKFVEEVARVLNPGGRFIIYNICPRQKKPEEGYIPWADGRCPFPREMLERHGLKVLEFDRDDTEMMRQHAIALEWHQGESAMDLNNDLVVTYTLCERVALKSEKGGEKGK